MTDDAIREWAGKTFNQVLIKLDATVLETAARELLAMREAELKAVFEDAERYRWLRDGAQWHRYIRVFERNPETTEQAILCDEYLDAAIDAARKEQGHG